MRVAAACALATLGLIYAATIPEPQAERARRAVSFKRQRVAVRRTRSFKQIASLGRSSHFILLASIACIGSMIAEGLQEVSAQFFQLEVGFTMDDQATLMIVIGASGLVMQMVLLPLVMAACEGRERFILIATSALLAIINTLLACFSHHHKGLAMGLQGLAMIGLVTFTVTSGILSKAVSEKHQVSSNARAYFWRETPSKPLTPTPLLPLPLPLPLLLPYLRKRKRRGF